MIKFFRSIRQQMIFKKNISKYSLYAFGEIVLVVIGILIALQINTWNQNREDGNKEIQILSELYKEYTNNLDQINSKIHVREEIIKSSLALLDYRDKAESEIDQDSFNILIGRLITRPTYDPELGVTNELINSGKLYLVSNDSLRKQLTSFSSFLGELREEEMVTFNYVENILIPFLNKNYRMGKVAANFLDDVTFQSKFAIANLNSNKSISDLFEQGDVASLINNREFENHLAMSIGVISYANVQSEGVRQRVEDIISIIKTELSY